MINYNLLSRMNVDNPGLMSRYNASSPGVRQQILSGFGNYMQDMAQRRSNWANSGHPTMSTGQLYQAPGHTLGGYLQGIAGPNYGAGTPLFGGAAGGNTSGNGGVMSNLNSNPAVAGVGTQGYTGYGNSSIAGPAPTTTDSSIPSTTTPTTPVSQQQTSTNANAGAISPNDWQGFYAGTPTGMTTTNTFNTAPVTRRVNPTNPIAPPPSSTTMSNLNTSPALRSSLFNSRF